MVAVLVVTGACGSDDDGAGGSAVGGDEETSDGERTTTTFEDPEVAECVEVLTVALLGAIEATVAPSGLSGGQTYGEWANEAGNHYGFGTPEAELSTDIVVPATQQAVQDLGHASAFVEEEVRLGCERLYSAEEVGDPAGEEARTSSIELSRFGLGVALFGDGGEALGRLTDALGPGGAQGQPCGSDLTPIAWGGAFVTLTAFFESDGRFAGYRLYTGMGGEPDFAYTTAEGIGIDATVEDLTAAYGERVEVAGAEPALFTIDGPDGIRGEFDPTIGSPPGLVRLLEAGDTCPL